MDKAASRIRLHAYKSNMTMKVVTSCSNIDFQDVT